MAKKKDYKSEIEKLLNLGATPEVISNYLNMELSMVQWYITQLQRERERHDL